MGPKDKKPPIDYVEVCTLFSNAEGKIKNVEHLAGGVVIPAINQLRYAGQHLVRNLSGCADPEEELRQSANHCKRASYDACEAGLLYCLKIFKQFQEDYRKTNIIPVLPDWLSHCASARKAQSLVQITQDEDRVISYKKAEASLTELLGIVAKLPDAREELNKTFENERRNFRILIYCLIVAIASLAIAVFAYVKPPSASAVRNISAPLQIPTHSPNVVSAPPSP